MSDIKRYRDFALDQFSIKGAGLTVDLADKFGDWWVAPALLIRGSTLIRAANYKSVVSALKDGGHDYFEYSAHNWQVGWVTLCLVKPDKESKSHDLLQDLYDCQEEFGCIASRQYSQMQLEAIENYWNNTNLHQLMEDCNRADLSVFLSREKTLPRNMFSYYQQQKDFQ